MVLTRKFADYIKSNLLFVVFTYVLFIALFGAWTFHDMVTFDSESFYDDELGAKWYRQWFDIGRWAFVALKALLGTIIINPFFSTALFVLLFPMSFILWAFALSHWTNNDSMRWQGFVFVALAMSHPVWAQQFAYRNQMEVMSVALLLAPIALLVFTEFLKTKRISYAISSLVLFVVLFGSYQSFVFLIPEGICFYLAIAALSGVGGICKSDDTDVAHASHAAPASKMALPGFKRQCWKNVLVSIVFVVVAFVLNSVISNVCQHFFGNANPDPYLSNQFSWGTESVGSCIHTILSSIYHTSFGNGLEYSAVFGIEAVAIVIWLVSILVRRKKMCGFITLVFFGILVLPFLLTIATATPIVIRSQFALVFALAFLGVFELQGVIKFFDDEDRRKSAAGVVSAIAVLVVFVLQSGTQTRLLYSDMKMMDDDRQNFEQIYYQAQKLGANDGDAVCFVGGRATDLGDSFVSSEIVGYSYLATPLYYDSAKASEAMKAYGLDVSTPTGEQEAAAKQETEEMSVWPHDGSISVHDGYFVVKLSEAPPA